MNKRTIQIDVIGPIEETELMKCKLYVDGRVCVIGMSRYDYEELMREKVFIYSCRAKKKRCNNAADIFLPC